MKGRTTNSMKKGWLYRTSCDEKNQEIAPFWDSTDDDDPNQVMIQIKWWSRCDDDPNLMMIQIKWWSRFDDDLAVMIQQSWWSRSRDEEDLKKNMT